MNPLVIGGAAGVVLAFAALAFGFWGFLLVAIFAAVGALVGGVATRRIDLPAAVQAARGGRRSG
jgi:uncharacterized membrane protein